MCCVQCRVSVVACVLCAVQSETVERHVCCVQCRVSVVACVLCAVQSESSGMCVVCSAE